MANIQVKNIPERLHNKLRRYAREQESTLGEIVLEAIEREVRGASGTSAFPAARRLGCEFQPRSY